MSGPDPGKLIEAVNRQSALDKIEWLEGFAARLVHEGGVEMTDINGLQALAASIRRGLEK